MDIPTDQPIDVCCASLMSPLRMGDINATLHAYHNACILVFIAWLISMVCWNRKVTQRFIDHEDAMIPLFTMVATNTDYTI